MAAEKEKEKWVETQKEHKGFSLLPISWRMSLHHIRRSWADEPRESSRTFVARPVMPTAISSNNFPSFTYMSQSSVREQWTSDWNTLQTRLCRLTFALISYRRTSFMMASVESSFSEIHCWCWTSHRNISPQKNLININVYGYNFWQFMQNITLVIAMP